MHRAFSFQAPSGSLDTVKAILPSLRFLPLPSVASMSASQPNLFAHHPPPPYSAEPRRGHEQRLLVHDPPNVPLSVASPPRQWQDQFVKHSKSGSVTLKVFNQRPHVPSPIHHGGANNPIRGCVDLTKTENVTSVELKECIASTYLSHPFPGLPSKRVFKS